MSIVTPVLTLFVTTFSQKWSKSSHLWIYHHHIFLWKWQFFKERCDQEVRFGFISVSHNQNEPSGPSHSYLRRSHRPQLLGELRRLFLSRTNFRKSFEFFDLNFVSKYNLIFLLRMYNMCNSCTYVRTCT